MNYKVNRILFYLPRLIKKTYICLRFPFLKYYCDTPFYEFCYWGQIDKGWRKAFGWQMCKELRAAAKRHGVLKTFRFIDVKQKYGYLDITVNSAPEEIFDILSKYDYISIRTCINCGRRAKYVTRAWVLPYCEDCLPKNAYGADEYIKDIEWYGCRSVDLLLKEKENK